MANSGRDERRTVAMDRRLWSDSRYEVREGKKYFDGFPVIERDGRINGGVSVGATEREAILVDDTRESEAILLAIYQDVLKEINKSGEKDPQKYILRVLKTVYDATSKRMVPDRKRAEHIAPTSLPDEIKPLSIFFKGGVCRHKALLAGYLLEKLINDGVLEGSASIDRNTGIDPVTGEKSGHVWARYVGPDKKSIYIVDAALQFLGPLNTRYEDKRQWNYSREEDDRAKIRKVFDVDPFVGLDRSFGEKLMGFARSLVPGGGKREAKKDVVIAQPEPVKLEAPVRESRIESHPVMMFPALKKTDKPYEKEPEPFPFTNLKDLWRADDPEGTNPMNPYTKGNRWKDE